MLELRKIVSVFTAAVSAMTLITATGCSSNNDATEDDFVLKIAYDNDLCEAPIQMGVELGFFEAEGLNVEMVKSDGSQLTETVGSGQVNAGFGLLGKFLQPIDNGLDIKITAGIHTGCVKILVPEDSDIYSVEDLKGKTVGTPGLGSAPTMITRRSLYHAGLNASANNCDVDFAVYESTDLALALANGAIDAVAMGDPQASIAQNEYNLRTIVDTTNDDEYKDEYCCVIFVTGDVAENHSDIADKFTRAVMKASQYVEENPEEVARIQIEKEWVAGDLESNSQILDSYNFKPSIEGAYTALKITVPDLQAIGLISADRDSDEFIDSIIYKSDNLNDADILGSVATNE